MVWQRLGVTAFTILALASGGPLSAADKEKPQAGQGSDRLDAVVAKLKLTDQQKQKVKEIYADFDRKADPLIRQLCTERGKEWQALQDTLNDMQKAKLKEVLEAQGAKELQSVAQKLGLSDEQKERVKKIREDFWKRFLNLSIQKGEHMAREYRELYADTVATGCEGLSPEQCTKLPEIQRLDFEDWHDYMYRADHLKALGEQLGLTDAQVKKLQKECAAHEKKLEEPKTKLKEICKEECAALEKVLNAEQRAKLRHVFPLDFMGGEHPPAGKGK